MKSKIYLTGMEFYAYHGCFKEERQVGILFKVDLELEYDATMATQTDNISNAVNYHSVYLEVKKIMQTPVNLLETLCKKILSMVKEKFPQVIHAEVSALKSNPAMGGKVASVSVKQSY